MDAEDTAIAAKVYRYRKEMKLPVRSDGFLRSNRLENITYTINIGAYGTRAHIPLLWNLIDCLAGVAAT